MLRVCAGVLCVVVLAGCTHQRSLSVPPTPAEVEAVDAAAERGAATVVRTGGQRERVTDFDLTADALVHGERDAVRIPLHEVERIWIRSRPAGVRDGALAGAATGAALGFVLVPGLGDCSGGCESSRVSVAAAAVGGAVGLLAGMLVGGIVGATYDFVVEPPAPVAPEPVR